MNAALAVGACLCFFAGFPAPALILRCGLSACLRFSPRAAMGLSGLAALFACVVSLCVRAIQGKRLAFAPLLPAIAFLGGAFGRACALILDASLPSSLSLLRVQAPMLAALMLAVLLVRPRKTDAATQAAACIAFALAALDGFFGTDCALLLARLARRGGVVRLRHRADGASILACASAQLGALLLTQLCGAALIFPARMLAFLCTGAAVGAALCRAAKKRGALFPALSSVMRGYGVLAALACAGHAFFPRLSFTA